MSQEENIMSTTWSVMFLIGGILFFLGVLIGSTMTVHAMSANRRRQAALQRNLNAQWQDIQAAYHQLHELSNHEWLRQEQSLLLVDGEVAVVIDELMVRS